MTREIKPLIVQFAVPAASPPIVPPLIVDDLSGLLRRIDTTNALVEEILAGDASTSKEWADITLVTKHADPVDPDLVRGDFCSQRCAESTLLTKGASDPRDPDAIRCEGQRKFAAAMSTTQMTGGEIDQLDPDSIRARNVAALPFAREDADPLLIRA